MYVIGKLNEFQDWDYEFINGVNDPPLPELERAERAARNYSAADNAPYSVGEAIDGDPTDDPRVESLAVAIHGCLYRRVNAPQRRLAKRLATDPIFPALPDNEAKARFIAASPDLMLLALLDACDGLIPEDRGTKPLEKAFDPETRRIYLPHGNAAEWRIRAFEDRPIDAITNPQHAKGVVYFIQARRPSR